jgi:hypothetical protein
VGAEQQAALVRAFQSLDAQVRARVLPIVLQMFNGLGSWRDTDIERFTTAVVPLIVGAERQMGSLTNAYISAMVADMLGTPPTRAAGDVATGAALRGGVEPAEVYARPIRAVWRSLAAGNDMDAALASARLRLWQITTTDLQLAKDHAARAAIAADHRVVGYRRVLTGSHSCGLCLVASTQRYRRGDLMPIHPGCDCGIAPIVGTDDPGQLLNEPLLEGTHAAIADRFGASGRAAREPIDYRNVLVTHEHGEIGPVLDRKGDHFAGPDDLGGSA